MKEGCWLKLNLGQDPHHRRDSWTPNELSQRRSGRVLEAQDQVSAGPSFKDPAQTSRRPGCSGGRSQLMLAPAGHTLLDRAASTPDRGQPRVQTPPSWAGRSRLT